MAFGCKKTPENTAAGISPKSQKEHSSSMIKEHVLFVLICIYMCVYYEYIYIHNVYTIVYCEYILL